MSETLFGSDDAKESPADLDLDLIALYRRQGRTLDDLPYTPEFEAIYEGLVGDGSAEEPLAHLARAEVFHRLHNLRKAGKLPRLGRSPSSPPKIAEDEERLLLNLVADAVGRISKRDQLPFTEAFDAIVTRFNSETSHNLSPHDLWRIIQRVAKRSSDPADHPQRERDDSPTELQLANALSGSEAEDETRDDELNAEAPAGGAGDDADEHAITASAPARTPDAPAGERLVPKVYDVSREGYEGVADGFRMHARRTMHGAAVRIEHCLKQLSNVDIWWRPHPSINAIGNIVLHVMGNLGQWVVEGAGEKRFYRNRDAEFAQRHPIGREEMIERLRSMVHDCDRAIAQLDADGLMQPRRVQGFDTDKLGAIFHSISHMEGHAQEIIYITRLRLGDDYEFLFKPKGPEQQSSENTRG